MTIKLHLFCKCLLIFFFIQRNRKVKKRSSKESGVSRYQVPLSFSYPLLFAKNSTTYSVSKRRVTTNIACIFPFARFQHEKKKKKISPNIFRKQKFFASFSFFRKKHFCVRVNNFPLCIFNHTQFINYYERNEGKIIFVNGFSMPFENSEGKFM